MPGTQPTGQIVAQHPRQARASSARGHGDEQIPAPQHRGHEEGAQGRVVGDRYEGPDATRRSRDSPVHRGLAGGGHHETRPCKMKGPVRGARPANPAEGRPPADGRDDAGRHDDDVCPRPLQRRDLALGHSPASHDDPPDAGLIQDQGEPPRRPPADQDARSRPPLPGSAGRGSQS